MEKRWCTYTMGYYSAIKEQETTPSAATRADLETVLLSEERQTETNTRYCSCVQSKKGINERIYKTGTESLLSEERQAERQIHDTACVCNLKRA